MYTNIYYIYLKLCILLTKAETKILSHRDREEDNLEQSGLQITMPVSGFKKINKKYYARYQPKYLYKREYPTMKIFAGRTHCPSTGTVCMSQLLIGQKDLKKVKSGRQR